MTAWEWLLDFFFFLMETGWGGEVSGNCIISGHINFTAWVPAVVQLESPTVCS